MMKLTFITSELNTKENKKAIKQAITIAHKIDTLQGDLLFLESDLTEAIKKSDFAEVATISAEIAKKANKIIKLEEDVKESTIIAKIYEEVKHERFVLELDWVYIANRNMVAIDSILFTENYLNKI